MKTNLWFLFLSVVVTVFCSSLIYSSEVVFPAGQIEDGKCSFFILSGNSSDKLNFSVASKDEIKVGNNSYFSEVTNDFEGDGRGNSVLAKLAFNPGGGLYYWFKAGIGSYDLSLPSSTVKNKLSGQDKGWICGLGARKLLFPDTIVTPAIAVDVGISYMSYGLDSFSFGGSAPVSVSDKLEITEAQADVVISKIINSIEPYGGLKVYRKSAVLSDRASFVNVSGIKDSAGLFFGVKFSFCKHEALVVEGNVGGDTDFTVGLNIGF